MNVSGQPACSTILADRASKQQGMTWQASCDNNARKSALVPVAEVTVQTPQYGWLGNGKNQSKAMNTG